MFLCPFIIEKIQFYYHHVILKKINENSFDHGMTILYCSRSFATERVLSWELALIPAHYNYLAHSGTLTCCLSERGIVSFYFFAQHSFNFISLISNWRFLLVSLKALVLDLICLPDKSVVWAAFLAAISWLTSMLHSSN